MIAGLRARWRGAWLAAWLLCSLALSAPEPPPVELRPAPARKSWYINAGLGFSTTNLFGTETDKITQAPQRSSVLQTHLDLPGVYLPFFDHRLLLGLGFGVGETEYLPFQSTGIEHLGMTVLRAAVTTLYFFDGSDCLGPFVRLDAGLGRVIFTSEKPMSLPDGPRSGVALLSGLGWGFAVSAASRILLQMNYSILVLPRYGVGMLNATVGFLF